MTDYSELVKALRRCDMKQGCFNANCRYSVGKYFCDMDKVHKDAADAIEALNRLLDQNTQRCEALRKQLREAHESYERHLNELEAQLPKRGEWVHGKELSRAYVGNCCTGIVYEDFRCSACGVVIEECEKPKWNYCPNCGAKMEVQE